VRSLTPLATPMATPLAAEAPPSSMSTFGSRHILVRLQEHVGVLHTAFTGSQGHGHKAGRHHQKQTGRDCKLHDYHPWEWFESICLKDMELLLRMSFGIG